MYTRGLPIFNTYRDLFYKNKIKRIPEDIYNFLTPVALAHLIMGDGKGRKHGLNICLDSYNLKDIIRLMNVLIIKYNYKYFSYLKKNNNKILFYIKYINFFIIKKKKFKFKIIIIIFL